MTTQRAPFVPGDVIEFSHSGSGYPKGTRCVVKAIGFEREDKRSKGAWRCKISIGDKSLYWSAGWFVKAKGK